MSKDNITKLRPAADPDEVLKAAIGQVDEVVILGVKDDQVDYFAASLGLNETEVLWIIEKFKHELMSQASD